ncbi:small nucleolar ribonucleoprotein complex subunit, putative [Talaromyces stipitatus ATCC 10500]|uniref:Small nucleolar ribonucleoprotein complex subunit, putative n=1 Tax=Talaromyces stipitatus (strain ATCC 10500 / CBS 375.48 / QM 6759 / NRRL 1006) TaxID=441959 RepID=B8LT63_TALSN|nr:small nucleolar ribonucleoprotein complex subunit, putative [Talaromyces stipitatus ATCC 10500]EED23571.1 small nucleolar ribonucleoprotein complex subunit, putative [Talaromyces stipitatus ATCC 10500]
MVGAKRKVATAIRTKSTGPSSSAKASHHEFDMTDKDYNSSDSEGDDEDDIPEKDEVEEKLEQMLFGDDEGFQEALKNHGRHQESTGLVMRSDQEDGEGEVEDEDKHNMDDVADADLFFLDSGAPEVQDAIDHHPDALAVELKGESGAVTKPAVWNDSDDERMAISLAGHRQLRKLRVVESEDVVNGTEYIRRLRTQYLRLHPTPDWANTELRNKRKSRRNSHGTNGSEDGVSSSEDDMDTDDDEDLSTKPLAKLLQGAGDLIKGSEDGATGKRAKLRQEVIDIRRLKDVGGVQPSSIDSLSFHPHYSLLLSSGPASTVWLHHISPSAPTPSNLLTSLQIRKTPLYTSAFSSPTGNKIYASGRRRYFHVWDLESGRIEKINPTADRKEEQKSMERFKLSPCGRYIGLIGSARKGGGMINILDSTTARWIAQARVDGLGGVADFAWWSDGNGMVIASKNGEISEFDMRLRRVICRWTDAGAVGTTVIALGGSSGRPQLGGDRWVAVGSFSGIVNIYDRKPWQGAAAQAEQSKKHNIEDAIPSNPTPVRALEQLTTSITQIVFAPDGQFMVMASKWKRDALRLVHLPSCTVYRNWPTSNTPFGRITSVTISPQSNLLAVANEQGKIRLWEING